jgi:hypothetical protein
MPTNIGVSHSETQWIEWREVTAFMCQDLDVVTSCRNRVCRFYQDSLGTATACRKPLRDEADL